MFIRILIFCKFLKYLEILIMSHTVYGGSSLADRFSADDPNKFHVYYPAELHMFRTMVNFTEAEELMVITLFIGFFYFFIWTRYYIVEYM